MTRLVLCVVGSVQFGSLGFQPGLPNSKDVGASLSRFTPACSCLPAISQGLASLNRWTFPAATLMKSGKSRLLSDRKNRYPISTVPSSSTINCRNSQRRTGSINSLFLNGVKGRCEYA